MYRSQRRSWHKRVNQEQWPALGFIEHAPDIFTQYANCDELGAAQKQHGNHDRWVPSIGFAKHERFKYDPDRKQESATGNEQTEISGHLQWCNGEGRNAF